MARPVEATDLSFNEWKVFVESPVWAALKNEIQARDDYIMSLLREGGDKIWSDDNMRGRLNELEYVLQIPFIVMADLQISQTTKEKELGNDSR